MQADANVDLVESAINERAQLTLLPHKFLTGSCLVGTAALIVSAATLLLLLRSLTHHSILIKVRVLTVRDLVAVHVQSCYLAVCGHHKVFEQVRLLIEVFSEVL